MWLDLESANAGNGLSSLLCAMDSKKSKNAGENNILITSLQVWQAIRKLEGHSKILSSLAPIYGNTDFAPARSDLGFRMWEERGF